VLANAKEAHPKAFSLGRRCPRGGRMWGIYRSSEFAGDSRRMQADTAPHISLASLDSFSPGRSQEISLLPREKVPPQGADVRNLPQQRIRRRFAPDASGYRTPHQSRFARQLLPREKPGNQPSPWGEGAPRRGRMWGIYRSSEFAGDSRRMQVGTAPHISLASLDSFSPGRSQGISLLPGEKVPPVGGGCGGFTAAANSPETHAGCRRVPRPTSVSLRSTASPQGEARK